MAFCTVNQNSLETTDWIWGSLWTWAPLQPQGWLLWHWVQRWKCSFPSLLFGCLFLGRTSTILAYFKTSLRWYSLALGWQYRKIQEGENGCLPTIHWQQEISHQYPKTVSTPYPGLNPKCGRSRIFAWIRWACSWLMSTFCISLFKNRRSHTGAVGEGGDYLFLD